MTNLANKLFDSLQKATNLANKLFDSLQKATLTELHEARKQAIANGNDLRLSPSDRPSWKAIAVLLTKIIREY